jgi:pyrroline-5-carboxylate reductase
MKDLRIGFIGSGNIAGALINAVLGAKLFAPNEVSVFDPDASKTEIFAKAGVLVSRDNPALVANSDIIVLAVKPQIIDLVLSEIGTLCGGKCLVTVAAGISSDYIRCFTGKSANILRVMPNTPMLLNKGAIAIARSPGMDETLFKSLCSIFECCGHVEILDEANMNDVIAVNGSSPAFFYRFVEVIADYAESHGIDRNVAIRLAAKTLEGSAAMLLTSGKTPAQLIKDVSSPGGTTLAALHEMDELNLDGIFTAALEACGKRANELGK